MTATTRQVAEVAGVSSATVSRVFTESGPVSGATRTKVLSAAERLGYSPSPVSRRNALQQTGTLGLSVPTLENPHFASAVTETLRIARRRGWSVFVGDLDERGEDEALLARSMAEHVDGLILWSSGLSSEALAELKASVPTVVVNQANDVVPAVLLQMEDGIRQAIEHLHALRHQRICYVVPRAVRASRSPSAQMRLELVREACSAVGMELIELGPYYSAQFDAGLHAADLVTYNEATAVIAYNDLVAAGLLRQFFVRGTSIPEQMSVIGIDDTLLAATASPALTSVRIPVDEVAKHAVDLLMAEVDATTPVNPPTSEVGTQLIVRQSTGPAPSARSD